MIEPSAAVPVAALMAGRLDVLPDGTRPTRVGVILSGGNLDPDRLPALLGA